MAEKMNFDGRVAVITGAGGGLGKEYAIAFARRGAKVVVNDLGGSSGGVGQSKKLADEVVHEIKSFGGEAVANYDSVEDGEKVIKTAIDAYGRVDILVNNAGILRDRSFTNMTDDEWDIVIRVHLRGAFKMTKAAWSYFRKQKYGRIIMISSNSGAQGSFGQANYSSAKMGLVGLAKTLAKEGAKYNIMCNTILPIATSRLTKGTIPDALTGHLKPKYIAPIVLLLCHESCPSSGDVYMSAGGFVQRIRQQISVGYQFLKYGENFGPEHIQNHWSEIQTFDTKEMPKEAVELLASLASGAADAITETSKDESNDNTDAGKLEKFIGFQMDEKLFTYTANDAILYAISIGATIGYENYDDLKYLYENDDSFSVFPTFGVIPGMTPMEQIIHIFMENGLDVVKMLHGEQYTEAFAPLPASGTLKSTAKVVDVVDKGTGMLVAIDCHTYTEMNDPVSYNQIVLFFAGAGGYGGKKKSSHIKELSERPQRAPDAVVEEMVPLNQAAIYRLNQDKNPIHIDPQIANLAGFGAPILHGLCTYGYAVRHVLKSYAGNDTGKFRAMKARFSAPVLPGQTVVTQMWQEGKRIHYEVLVKETDRKAITGGYVDLKDVPRKDTEVRVKTEDTAEEQVFAEIKTRVQESPDIVQSLKGVLVYHLTKDGNPKGTWIIDLKSDPPKVFKGSFSGKPDLTVTVSSDDFIALASGKLSPTAAFMNGKIKLKGNLALAQKMNKLLSIQAKL